MLNPITGVIELKQRKIDIPIEELGVKQNDLKTKTMGQHTF